MKIMFIHPNMPGQYKHLARIFAEDPANEVVFLTKPRPHIEIPNVKKITFNMNRDVGPETHRYLVNFERGILQGQEVWRVCKKLKENGFTPDVICSHPGWGSSLFVKEIYPDAPLLNYQEFFYKPTGADVNFLPEDIITPDDMARIRIKNTINLYGVSYCDWGITPTFWQQSVFPKEFHNKISVLHDGIDTDALKPVQWEKAKFGEKLEITRDDEIITYISRNFEPYRGLPTFLKAIDIVLKKRPKAQAIAIGGDDISYGKKHPSGQPWRHIYLNQIKPDMSRLHFVGFQQYDQMVRMLQISSAHIYLTVPFVLSWSMLEAMSLGCAVVGSDTEPVREVIKHGENGLLADFFSAEDVADKICQILDDKKRADKMRKAARETIVDRYDMKKVLPLHIDLIKDMAAGRLPPPAAESIDKFNSKNNIKLAA